MPTGYTSALYEGKEVSFPEFVMQCARAFGALVTMRDDPMDAPIPDEFAPSNYYDEQLKLAESRLEKIKNWDSKKANQEALKLYKKSLKDYEVSVERVNALKARYEDMLAKVNNWNAPTPDHEGLKKFMVNQLQESIEFDCNTPEKPKKISGASYKGQCIKSEKWNIAYHTKEKEAEAKRCAERTNWVRDLRKSILYEKDSL